ncbi:hypothetical protein LSTR_LSTR004184, partial [Laodelphax striatellus]
MLRYAKALQLKINFENSSGGGPVFTWRTSHHYRLHNTDGILLIPNIAMELQCHSAAVSAAFLCSMLAFALSHALARGLEQPLYDTAYACEGKTLKIECKSGELIHLIRANYGRFSITICNDHGNTDWSVNCMSPKSLRVLHS